MKILWSFFLILGCFSDLIWQNRQGNNVMLHVTYLKNRINHMANLKTETDSFMVSQLEEMLKTAAGRKILKNFMKKLALGRKNSSRRRLRPFRN